LARAGEVARHQGRVVGETVKAFVKSEPRDVAAVKASSEHANNAGNRQYNARQHHNNHQSTFIVVDGWLGCLLSHNRQLGLYQLEKFKELNVNIAHIGYGCSGLVKEFPNVFTKEIGEFKDYRVLIHIRKDVKPVAQPLRWVAYYMLRKADAAYDELLKMMLSKK
jgi:hypothetical protein